MVWIDLLDIYVNVQFEQAPITSKNWIWFEILFDFSNLLIWAHFNSIPFICPFGQQPLIFLYEYFIASLRCSLLLVSICLSNQFLSLYFACYLCWQCLKEYYFSFKGAFEKTGDCCLNFCVAICESADVVSVKWSDVNTYELDDLTMTS